jgi:hypothetical protein
MYALMESAIDIYFVVYKNEKYLLSYDCEKKNSMNW